MAALFLHPDKAVRDVVAFAIESRLGVTAYTEAGCLDAVEFLSQAHSLKMIVYFSELETDPAYKAFLKQAGPVPRIVGYPPGQKSRDTRALAEVDLANFIEDLIAKVELLKKEQKLVLQTTDEEYCRIPTALLIQASPLEGDVYIRLSKDHYVKMFREGDAFDLEDLKRYAEEKKQPYLHLRKEDTADFLRKYEAILLGLILRGPLSEARAEELAISVHATIHDLSDQLGFTEEIQDLTKTSVKMTLKAMGNAPTLAKVLERIQKDDGRYISSHSTILAHLSCALAYRMQWHSEATYFKLSLASFLHDMALKDDEKAKVRRLDEDSIRAHNLSPADVDLIKKHPLAAAEIARRFSQVPPDVDSIILQHHEKPDGSGFPRGLTGPNINQMACVFVVAHEIVESMVVDRQSFPEILAKLREQFQSGTFKKIVSLLPDDLDELRGKTGS